MIYDCFVFMNIVFFIKLYFDSDKTMNFFKLKKNSHFLKTLEWIFVIVGTVSSP